ncbi:MAG: cystathionine beta-lyase [Bradyrhizobium sp.]|jgi:cystathionine beta-lyase|nr:cystathionine beta-lyase [Bradyrhizobium sp.]MEA2866181.1 cysteine-S-conjugate beta-lyase [Bradyrhizobium sp.]
MIDDPPRLRPKSRLIHGGRPDARSKGPVNPPIVRASTILHRTVADMRGVEAERAAGHRVQTYGRRGTDTGFALEDALTDLEHGHGARLTASGLAANALVFLSYLKPGDHVAISDGVYGPVRRFAKNFLTTYGIAYDFFPANGSDLESFLRPQTKLVYLECPGSSLFEIADLPRLGAIAHDLGITVAVDSTWGSGWTYHPLILGADVSILSATKYLAGHSDVLLGAVVTNEAAWPALDGMAELMGAACSPEDAYLVLRGLRTLGVRLGEHERNARILADWFVAQPWVKRVYFPPLENHSAHALWRRDFSGACGLFSVEFGGVGEPVVEKFLDRLNLFGLGSSWGGFESLARPEPWATLRTASPNPAGPLVRFHAGLEDVEDLLTDLQAAAATFAEAR